MTSYLIDHVAASLCRGERFFHRTATERRGYKILVGRDRRTRR
jgi:hypothetical protein